MKDLLAQLRSEWGGGEKDKRQGREKTNEGLDIEVSPGGSWTADIRVIVHSMDENAPKKGALGSHDASSNECHVYPKNIKKKGYSADPNFVAWLVNITAHEVGHYACANDNKGSGTKPGDPVPDKMCGWSDLLKKWAENQNPPKTFDDALKEQKFSDVDRKKQIANLNTGRPDCNTRSKPKMPGDYKYSTMVIDDPGGEEAGIANFAITVSGPRAGDFDLGFVNVGDDGLPSTSDDYVLTKWLGDKEMYIDWTPDDGIDNWEYYGPEPLDDVVSLFDTTWYSWAAIEISTGNEFLLQDFGILTLLEPAVNNIWNITVYETAVLDFDFNLDDLVDLSFVMSSDLSGLVTEDGELLYGLNKPGTGFTTEPIPEPATVLLLGLGGLALLRRRRRLTN